MPLHGLIQRYKGFSRFQRYLLARRSLSRQVFATTPWRYLQKLNLVPSLDDGGAGLGAPVWRWFWDVEPDSIEEFIPTETSTGVSHAVEDAHSDVPLRRVQPP